MANYERVIKRYKNAKGNKQLWDDHLKQCYRYAMPQRETIEQHSPGQKKRTFVFDSTAEDALEDFATRMESELVPPNINWMKLEAGVEIPKEEADNVTTFLEETTDTVFNHINSSNFSSQIHEAFLDLGISTGAIIVEAGDGIQSSLNFRCVSLSELYLEKSSRGIVTTVFRDIKIPVGDVLDTWKNATISEKMKELIAKDPSTEVTLIEGMIEEGDKFQSVVIWEQDKSFLLDLEMEYSPWIIFRESTIPGEVYGRGRVMRALADIKTLNIMMRDFLNGLRWYTNPTFTASDDGVINPHNYSLVPGTVNAVGGNGNLNTNPTIRGLEVSGQPVLLMDAMRMLQDSIRRVMISKPFGNVEETPVRTATEMSMRNADMAKTSLGASGRIQNELLETLVARCVYVLKNAGKVADFKVDGKEVKIKFTSPSSRSQDEQTLAAIGRASEMLMAYPPEMVNEQIALEKVPALIIDTLGLPASLKRSDAEKEQRQQQAQMAQQAQQEQLAAQVEAKENA